MRPPNDQATDDPFRPMASPYPLPHTHTIIFGAHRFHSRGCQRGTDEDDYLRACVQTTDGNVVVAGYSEGSVNGTENDGNFDIVAAKLEVNSGEEIWTYQVRQEDNTLTPVLVALIAFPDIRWAIL